MAQETPVNTGDQKAGLSGTDSVDMLISALRDLKSNISRVEGQHPSLRHDLSSLCDLVIGHLSRSSEDSDTLLTERFQNLDREEDSTILRKFEAVIQNLPLENDVQDVQSQDRIQSSHDDARIVDIVVTSPQDSPEKPQPLSSKTNIQPGAFSVASSPGKPLTNAFDKVGDGLLTGLDKMGDGVIFIFEKLLSLGTKKK